MALIEKYSTILNTVIFIVYLNSVILIKLFNHIFENDLISSLNWMSSERMKNLQFFHRSKLYFYIPTCSDFSPSLKWSVWLKCSRCIFWRRAFKKTSLFITLFLPFSSYFLVYSSTMLNRTMQAYFGFQIHNL